MLAMNKKCCTKAIGERNLHKMSPLKQSQASNHSQRFARYGSINLLLLLINGRKEDPAIIV